MVFSSLKTGPSYTMENDQLDPFSFRLSHVHVGPAHAPHLAVRMGCGGEPQGGDLRLGIEHTLGGEKAHATAGVSLVQHRTLVAAGGEVPSVPAVGEGGAKSAVKEAKVRLVNKLYAKER